MYKNRNNEIQEIGYKKNTNEFEKKDEKQVVTNENNIQKNKKENIIESKKTKKVDKEDNKED